MKRLSSQLVELASSCKRGISRIVSSYRRRIAVVIRLNALHQATGVVVGAIMMCEKGFGRLGVVMSKVQ